MKCFNITGKCYSKKHYMVDMKDRIKQIKGMVDRGEYVTINRGRQYGKTTILSELEECLSEDYAVYFVSFEGLGANSFENIEKLVRVFIETLDFAGMAYHTRNITDDMKQVISDYLCELKQSDDFSMQTFSKTITKLCLVSEKPVVLMIDEVDQASGYQAFIDFLGILRAKFLEREKYAAFQSVILASVYNIKNLKLKMRPDAEHQYNSPWNIASDFHVAMDFSLEDITGMLTEYEKDHNTEMDLTGMAQLIVDYTSGYPFLVSKICKMLDENEQEVWSRKSFLQVMKELLSEENTLFDDMAKKLQDFPEMKEMFKEILYNGRTYPFIIDDPIINIAFMFGYIKNIEGNVKIANRIFETRLYNLFVYEEGKSAKIYDAGAIDKNQFVKNGHLDMKRILERFCVHYTDIYGDRNEEFHEKEGRKYFLFYLKPIINGTGNYYVEAQTRDETRTDIIVDYRGEQFVIELKIWRGNAYNTRGEKQLVQYLEYFHTDTAYMLSFNFNKKKKTGVHEVQIEGKTLTEAVV